MYYTEQHEWNENKNKNKNGDTRKAEGKREKTAFFFYIEKRAIFFVEKALSFCSRTASSRGKSKWE